MVNSNDSVECGQKKSAHIARTNHSFVFTVLCLRFFQTGNSQLETLNWICPSRQGFISYGSTCGLRQSRCIIVNNIFCQKIFYVRNFWNSSLLIYTDPDYEKMDTHLHLSSHYSRRNSSLLVILSTPKYSGTRTRNAHPA